MTILTCFGKYFIIIVLNIYKPCYSSIITLQFREICMKKGFTLAETLITLGIIGVVAALTIPTLMKKYYEKQTVSRLRETQSILSQAIKMAEDEYGDVEGWGIVNSEASNNLVGERVTQFMKVAHICGTAVDREGKCTPASYDEKNGRSHNSVANYRYTSLYKFILNNGTSIYVQTPTERNNDIIGFYVDTNGTAKPNKIGVDLFYFIYGLNALRPLGAEDSNFPYSRDCKSKDSIGWGCAYYVLQNQRMDYPH